VKNRSDLTEARKNIQPTLWQKFFFLGGVSLSPTPQTTVELDRRDEVYRVRCEEQSDEKVILEYIERCGEQALTAKWVLEKIRFARTILDSDFSTLEQMFAALDPTPPMVYVSEPNGLPIQRDVAIAKIRKLASSFLRAIGPALANVGSGPRSILDTKARIKNRREQNYKHGTVRNYHKTAERLVKKIEREESYLRKRGKSPEQAKKQAKDFVLAEWKETTLAKNQLGILAIVKEILAGN
jgi:hypothetical protein